MILPDVFLVIVVIALLITIHEVGHLIIAKISRIPVEKFSVGFGPPLLSKKIKETTYALSLIPLGGYIKMKGEESEEPDGFLVQPVRKKIGVVLAGPLSNLLLGIFLMWLLYLIFGIRYAQPRIDFDGVNGVGGLLRGDLVVKVDEDTVDSFEDFYERIAEKNGEIVKLKIVSQNELKEIIWQVNDSLEYFKPFVLPVLERVKKGSPAFYAGLRTNDTIIAVNDTNILTWEEFVQKIRQSGGKSVKITYRRKGLSNSIFVTPKLVESDLSEERVGQIGVWAYLTRKNLGFFSSLAQAFQRSGTVIVQTFVVLYKLISGEISRKALGGPIMVAQLTYESVRWGGEYFLALWALLSINLFVVNMFPIPVLDGGRCLIFLIEGIRKRRFSKKETDIAITVGWILIMGLILFTFFNDITRIFKK